jgi:hypothetical protein
MLTFNYFTICVVNRLSYLQNIICTSFRARLVLFVVILLILGLSCGIGFYIPLIQGPSCCIGFYVPLIQGPSCCLGFNVPLIQGLSCCIGFMFHLYRECLVAL